MTVKELIEALQNLSDEYKDKRVYMIYEDSNEEMKYANVNEIDTDFDGVEHSVNIIS